MIMNEKYTMIRKEHCYKDKYYVYTVPQLPGLEAYTNIDGKVEQAIWYVKYKNCCKLEQSNCLPTWKRYVPIVNFFFEQRHRKRQYNLIFNEEHVGYMRFESIDLFRMKEKFIFNGKVYYIEQGNTFVLRPFKHYKWPIETDSGKIIATVETGHYTNRYEIEVLDDELDITVIIIMVMMSDIRFFSEVTASQW